jgi:hypothetical protein
LLLVATEFRTGRQGRLDIRAVARTWSVPLTLLALDIGIIIHWANGVANEPWVGVIAQIVAISVFVSALIVGGGVGARAGGREMVFELEDGALIRRRRGSADVEIRFAEVTSLRRAWVLVRG